MRLNLPRAGGRNAVSKHPLSHGPLFRGLPADSCRHSLHVSLKIGFGMTKAARSLGMNGRLLRAASNHIIVSLSVMLHQIGNGDVVQIVADDLA